MPLPTEYKARKEFPLFTFLTAYFPDMIEKLVELCVQGNKQHAIEKPSIQPFWLETDRIAWDRGKSTEEMETAMRHLWEHMRAKRGVGSIYDSDGILHIVKAMWRCGSEGQRTIEAERAKTAEPEAVHDKGRCPCHKCMTFRSIQDATGWVEPKAAPEVPSESERARFLRAGGLPI